MNSKALIWLKEVRLQFCTASVIPILIGTALAWSHTHEFNLVLFSLAVFSISFFQMGANVSNDYFDSKSKNDWLNKNPTPFSGGAQIIQKNLLTPKEVLIGSLILFASGAALGLVILAITKSLFVLSLGIIGLLGAFFYTAPPLKLGYRTAGEITIGFLFGILPVYGAYYIQTDLIDLVPLLPSLFVAVLIFLVIFANEFPDYLADKAVNKRTLVVTLGIKKAAILYKAALFVVTILSLFMIENFMVRLILFVMIGFLCINCFKACNPEKLSQQGYSNLSKYTILLHTIGGITFAAAVLFASAFL
ncbi:MAG: hypothetical protein A2Y10_02805 [Planctomycetes bacterium GWF2_41_51]|nr:MAG: hypothetical protein A2Y10_02805 [Planctomycetes bacterium GWF2_41_51]HBG27480.1 1,4-dihydroxy-2-naphthoate prenyltransferase [Phycisphaerales bacterium]